MEMNYDTLGDTDIDRLVFIHLGYRETDAGEYEKGTEGENGYIRYRGLLNFSIADTSLIDMIEEEVERRGIWMEYTAALLADDIFQQFVKERTQKPVIDMIVAFAWKALRTTPRQRCIAFLKATEVANESER